MRYTLRYKLHDFDLAQGEFVVGRAVTCELSLDDPMVSRAHAKLRVTPEQVLLEDLASRNGVKVNGERIQAVRKLEHGDQVVIGSQEMVLLIRREAPADTLVQQSPDRGASFGLLGALADKALGLGRGDEAERLVGQQLDQVLAEAEGGRAVSPDHIQRATDYALRIASFTQNARWTDFIFRLYSALRRPCAAPVVDQLYTVLRKVQRPAPQALRTYLGVLHGLDLGPADRFLVKRIEGLERLIGAR
jgi:pSer/pThr/pTyr-binding forkhead associated (FHA) protein